MLLLCDTGGFTTRITSRNIFHTSVEEECVHIIIL
jgi:hypothetical protein